MFYASNYTCALWLHATKRWGGICQQSTSKNSLHRPLANGAIAKRTPSVRYSSERLTDRSKLVLNRDYTFICGQHPSRALASPRKHASRTVIDTDVIAELRRQADLSLPSNNLHSAPIQSPKYLHFSRNSCKPRSRKPLRRRQTIILFTTSQFPHPPPV